SSRRLAADSLNDACTSVHVALRPTVAIALIAWRDFRSVSVAHLRHTPCSGRSTLMKRTTSIMSACFAALMALSLGACDEVEHTLDCAEVCDTYNDCVDDDVDRTECVDSCTDFADENQSNADRIEACASCVDDQSCVESGFQCLDECAFIPVQ